MKYFPLTNIIKKKLKPRFHFRFLIEFNETLLYNRIGKVEGNLVLL